MGAGYLHAPLGTDGAKDRASLEQDAALAAELGFRAQFVEEGPLCPKTRGCDLRTRRSFIPGNIWGGCPREDSRKTGALFLKTAPVSAIENGLAADVAGGKS